MYVFSVTLILKDIWRFKVKKLMPFVNTKVNSNKNESELEKENHTDEREQNLLISLYKNQE